MATSELPHTGVLAPLLAVGLKRIPETPGNSVPLLFGPDLWIDCDCDIAVILVRLAIASIQTRIGSRLGYVWRSRWQ
jgi:hypothetical protein